MSESRIVAYPFQKQTVFSVERDFKGRSLIANDMGLGKTRTALWFVKRKTLGETLPLLVVCPKIVKHQWTKAIEDVLGIVPDILETRKPPRVSNRTVVSIINYDIIAYWRDWLHNQNYKTIIVDECQYCKHPERKRTKTTVALLKQIKFGLALSGTPIENRPIEFFSIISALDPKTWPNRNLFGHKFCAPKFTRWGWQFTGCSNPGELNIRLRQSCMVRYLKKDVLQELPSKSRLIIPVELSNYKEYEKARGDFIGWIKETYPDRLNKSVKAAALVRSGHLLRLAARLKLRAVVDHINLRLEKDDEKIVVFGVHRKCIDALQRRIKADNVVVNGTVTGAARDKAIKSFQDPKGARVLVGNITAAGIGLNLMQAATMYVVELIQKPGPLIQLEDRIYRIGQNKNTWIYYMIATDTIEEQVCKLVQRKQRIITSVLDGGEVEEDFDLYDLIVKEIEEEDPSIRLRRRMV